MDNNTILFDHIETYPKRLVDYLRGLNPKEEFQKVDDDMVRYLETFNTYVYHCTRLENKEDILKHGIKRIAFNQQLKDYFASTLKKIGNDNYDFQSWINDYYYKSGRGTTVHATLTLSQIKEDAGCLPFFKFLGGEILTEIISDNLDKITGEKEKFENKINSYKICLSEIGAPYLVEIVLPIKDLPIEWSSMLGLLCRFYKNYSSEFKDHYIPNMDVVYKRDVFPYEIHDILDVDIDWYKQYI